jgi:undecaprenyl diphosphate synthase
VAIIMDGNGRWARKRALPRLAGHRAGVKNVQRILPCAREFSLTHLTLYAFSCENWNRPPEEVNALMNLLEDYLDSQAETLHKNRIRLRTIGQTQELPEKVAHKLQSTIEATAHYESWTLVLALNYGSRREITEGVKRYCHAVEEGREDLGKLDYQGFAKYLDTADIPDPDLIIRTSGETRLSNFLLLQSAYAELYFSKASWPDFDPGEFRAALEDYARRERRYGKTGDQIRSENPAAKTIFF